MTEQTTAPTAKTTAARKPRAAKAAPKPTPAPEPAKVEQPKKTANDYRREIDLLIIQAAGEIVSARVPAEQRDAVAQAIANQLHHLSTKKLGWPAGVLPTPDRSDWA